jgi:hypothetical protein
MTTEPVKTSGQPGRWMVSFKCWDDGGNTQACGAHWFKEFPTDKEIDGVLFEAMKGNPRARGFAMKVEPSA